MTIVGMDLGTTNSACAVWQDGQVKMIPNRLGELLTPSVVFIGQDGKVTVGKTAYEHRVLHPNSTASVFKRYMGTERTLTLNKKNFTAPELSAFVLRSLKEDAEAYLGHAVSEAVVSVPAYFSDTQRKATMLAAELVGLKVERLINEPTAAAMAYGLHEKPEHTQFMVVDLGGGTFDVSIMEYFDGVLEVHASAGDNFLGGEDFLEVLLQKYLTTLNISKQTLDKSDLQKVYAQMEQVKRKLNSVDVVHVEPFLKGRTETVDLRQDDFIQLSAPLLQRIQRPIETALRDANLKPWDLDEILLVGGATRMKFFRSMVAKMFRRMPSANLDPDLVVAMGAAIQGGLKARDAALEDVVLTDVCPYSLGTDIHNANDSTGTQGPLFDPIIERNTIVPASREKRYFTASDNQTTIELTILQGESRLARNNIKLGNMSLKVPKAKRGAESIDVRFSYDVNGLLEVDVRIVSTGETLNKVIENSPGQLTAAQITKSREKLASMKFHPREQEANRELIARAERLYEGRLQDDRDMIRHMLSQFEAALESQDEKAIAPVRQEFADFLEQLEKDNFFV